MADDEKTQNGDPATVADPAEGSPAAVAPSPEAVAEATPAPTGAGDETPEVGAEAPAPVVDEPSARAPRGVKARKPAPKKAKTSAERGEYTRTPPSDSEPGVRRERRGVVTSDKGDKTITVRVDVTKQHPKYKKILRRSISLRVHDERNEAHVGDSVRVVECRPMSATKRWRLIEVVEVAR